MDMWAPYIEATRHHVPDADDEIGFDHFHVAKHIGNAVNKVRVEEHAELKTLRDPLLTGTRYLWLQNPESMKPQNRLRFEEERVGDEGGRATLVVLRGPRLGHDGWTRLIDWMARSRLEAVDAKIKWLEMRASGYSNRARFRNAVLLHRGGLDLHPALARAQNEILKPVLGKNELTGLAPVLHRPPADRGVSIRPVATTVFGSLVTRSPASRESVQVRPAQPSKVAADEYGSRYPGSSRFPLAARCRRRLLSTYASALRTCRGERSGCAW